MKLDQFDIKILEELQNNAQISNQELAEKIGLSPSPCSRRVKQLEDSGYINKQVAILNHNKLGLNLIVFALVSMDQHTHERFNHFQEVIKQHPEIVECSLVTGLEADYQLKIIVSDMDSYQQFLLNILTRIDGVTNVRSSFVLQNIFSTTKIPLNSITL